MTTHAVIVHNLIQARAAGDQAKMIGVSLELRSPPWGAANMGPAVFHEITKELEESHPGIFTAVILDCGSDAGLAMAALRHGCRDICVNVPDEARAKLSAIASASAVRFHARTKITLDLGEIQKSEKNDLHALNSALRKYFSRDPKHD